MTPNIFGNSATLFLEASQQNVTKDNALIEATKTSKVSTEKSKNPSKYEWNIVWRNVIAFLYLHVGSLYALYLAFYEMKALTCLWTLSVLVTAALGITAGAHRLWCHRSYKAKWPLRLILMVFQTVSFQMLFLWSREPVPDPKASPWFAWFATAIVLWRCRRRIAKAILAVSPLRLLRRRCTAPLKSKVLIVQKSTKRIPTTTTATTTPHFPRLEKNPKLNVILHSKHTTGIKTRVKRLCTGDGPHVSGCTTVVKSPQQVNFRVTRSGRVYGKYPNKIVAPL